MQSYNLTLISCAIWHEWFWQKLFQRQTSGNWLPILFLREFWQIQDKIQDKR